MFQKCISIVKKQGNKVIVDDYKLLTYLVFDAPSHGGKYEDRVKWLQTNVPQDDENCYATVVGIKKCQGLDDLKQCLAEVTAAGGEGIMLRQPGSRYENKRSSTLLKVKTFYDEGKVEDTRQPSCIHLRCTFAEALVVGHKAGKGNCTGMLGALECQLPNGKRFDVGSGFNMAQRRAPPKKGAVITFKFQELSNAGIPRFPVFLRLRSDLTWKDVLEAAKTKTPVSTKQKVLPAAKLSKQHSILFSNIPSRDVQTGTKATSIDDEGGDDEEPTTAATKPAASARGATKNLKQGGRRPASAKTKAPAAGTTVRRGKTAATSKAPTTTSTLLVKDKNADRQLADDEDEPSEPPAKGSKRKRKVEEKPPVVKRARKS